MKLGDVLKKEREKKELSVEEIADKLAVSWDEYSQIETGDSPAEQWGLPFQELDDYPSAPRRRSPIKADRAAAASSA